ncbi:MAG: rRNA pseudouridine synthase [Proteobacteria bacterium]|nr:rRNA pseudouridine synthase [Pseudomonadota bacterium]
MIRLQKLLAGAGLGSRRVVEEWIRAGRVTLAGRTAQLGDRAAPGDDVRLDGRRLELQAAAPGSRELLLYYKPLGEVTTRSDPQGRPTVFERLPPPDVGRWINVGRLDVNTSGLLLLTTDGELAHRLMHPSSEVEREYRVRLRGRPGPQVLRQVLRGVPLEDGLARFDRVEPEPTPAGEPPEASHSIFRVVLHEGRNREVRRLWNAVGFEVSRLLRVRYGPIELPPDMRPGTVRRADQALIDRLDRAAGGGGAARPPAAPEGRPAAPPPRRPAAERPRPPAGSRRGPKAGRFPSK